MIEGGRLVVLSYHSLEDRRVKRLMKFGSVHAEEEPRNVARLKKSLRLDEELNMILDANEYLIERVDNQNTSNSSRLPFLSQKELDYYLTERRIKQLRQSFEEESLMRGEQREKLPWSTIQRKAITPTEIEIERNRRARSAKLRVAERNYCPLLQNGIFNTTASSSSTDQTSMNGESIPDRTKRKNKYGNIQIGAKQLRKMKERGEIEE